LIAGMAERGFLPAVMARRSRHGTASYAISILVFITIVLGTLSFESLVELVNINYAIAVLIYFASFIKLRISCPNSK
jgi:amino acid transporter